MSANRTETYDAVIIGARCAGAATGMLLGRRGLRVLAVDRSAYGSDTLSTHALMRTGVVQLHRWGLLPRVAAGTPAVRMAHFHYGERVVDVPVKPRSGVDALYAPRRTLLDRVLVDAAREAGVEVRHGTRLRSLQRDRGGRVRGVVLEDETGAVVEAASHIVIGADGLRSSTARQLAAPMLRTGRHASAIVYGYWDLPEVAAYHWYWRPGVSAGVIPTAGGQCCIFVAVPPRRFGDELAPALADGYRRVLAEAAPEIAAALARAEPAAPLRGFAGHPGFLRQSFGPGWALVGDAAYFKDPLGAHGISDALRDAELLARAVVRGTDAALAEYQAARDELSVRLFEETDEIASLDWDLATLEARHRAMSEEMAQELRAIARLDGAAVLAA